jgi:hypothetical protein
MRKLLIPVLILVCAALVAAQAPAQKWQVGTIMGVAQHDPVQDNHGNFLYDMTVQVGDKSYVVLYDSPLDTEIGRYKNGLETTVEVGEKVLKLNDLMGRTHDLPILAISEPQKPR